MLLLLLLLSRFSRVRLCVTPETAAHQAPPSLEFSRQKYWIGLPCLPPGDLPNPGIEPRSPTSQADSLPAEPQGKPKRCKLCPWVRKISWRRVWQPNPVFLPGEFHGQKSLVDYSPWSCKELDTTEQLSSIY